MKNLCSSSDSIHKKRKLQREENKFSIQYPKYIKTLTNQKVAGDFQIKFLNHVKQRI